MVETEKKKTGILSYGLVVMTVTHILTHLPSGVHTAIFSKLRDEFDLNLQQLGLMAAIPSLSSALLAIPVGLLSDRIGPKKMLLMSLVFTVAGGVIAGTASAPWMIVVAVSLIYMNTAIYHPASYAATAKMFNPQDRPKAMGLHGAGGTLGHAMGPLSVSLLIGILAWQWRQVYLFLAAPMILGIIMVLRLPADEEVKKVEKKETKGEKFLTTSLLMFLAYQATRMISSSMINTFLVLYLQDVRGMSLTVSTFLQSTNTLTGLIAAPIGGYLASRIGDKQWLETSLLGAFTILALAFQIQNNSLFMALYVLYGVGNTLGMAGRSSIMAKLTPSGQRGLGFALFFLPGSIIGSIAPFVAGYIADMMGFQTIFNVAVIVNFVALGILHFAVKVE